jgi:hypothetical protein
MVAEEDELQTANFLLEAHFIVPFVTALTKTGVLNRFGVVCPDFLQVHLSTTTGYIFYFPMGGALSH